MDPDAHLGHYRVGGAALATAARASLDAPVPSCPGWTVHDLVGHVGTLHAWTLACLAAGPDDRPRLREQPAPPDGVARVDWYLRTHDELADALNDSDQDRLVWSWAGRVPVRWWTRRQAHEVAVHRWDAQLAQGVPDAIAADLAVDGIDEYLDTFVPIVAEKLVGSGETIHLHATDGPGEWLIERRPSGPVVTHAHAKGDVALRGPASDLVLVLWGRRQLEEIEVFGDPEVFTAWRAIARF